MNMFFRGALVSFALLGAAPAFAATACNLLAPDVTNNVTANIGCEALISPDNDSPSAVDGMFGFDWDQLGKVDPPPGTDGPLTLTGDTKSGTWSIAASVFAMYEHVMIVFKGGDKALPDAVIGYLVNTTSGRYSSPFYDEHKGDYKQKDISHVSLYVSGDKVPEVPLPAAGFLMLGAIGGLAAVRRRRKLA